MQRIKNIERLFKGKSIGGGGKPIGLVKVAFEEVDLKLIQRINQHAGAFFGLDQSLPLLI